MSIVEITTFRLAEGVTDESFLALDRRVQTELVPNRPASCAGPRRATATTGSWSPCGPPTTPPPAFQRAVEGDPLQAEFERAAEAGTLHLARYTTLD